MDLADKDILDQPQQPDPTKDDDQNKGQVNGQQPTQKQNDGPDPKDVRIKELEESWKRALADYKNLERRFNEEKEVLVAFSNLVLLERLIPVLDNLESLVEHSKDKSAELIAKQLRDLISDEGVEEIVAMNKDFDPQSMEAVEIVEGEPNKVMEIVRKGYRLQNRVIRPVRVKVGKKLE